MIASLGRLVGHIYDRLPETTEVIITQIPPERGDVYPLILPSDTLWNDIVKLYNDRIPKVADNSRANGKHVSSVDMWGIIQSDFDLDEVGLHPRVAASERMAEVYFNKIMKILAQQP